MSFFKEKKGIIISFIIGVIIASSITVYATGYLASQVTYKDEKTVEQALNELYNKLNSTSGSTMIKLSETKVNSNENHTYNVSNIPGYRNFTEDNFLYSYVTTAWLGTASDAIEGISYDSNTGDVTFNASIGGGPNTKISIWYYPILIY